MWIPLKLRKPQKDGNYFVQGRDGFMGIGSWCSYSEAFHFQSTVHIPLVDGDVLNWLNDTPPPKELMPIWDAWKPIKYGNDEFMPLQRVGLYRDLYSLVEDVLEGWIIETTKSYLIRWGFDVYGLIPRTDTLPENVVLEDFNLLKDLPF